MPKRLLAILTCAMTSTATHAAAVDGLYLGAGAASIDGRHIAHVPLGNPKATSSGFMLFAGYQPLKYGSIEIGYVDLGEVQFRGAAGCMVAWDVSTREVYASANGRFPLNERFALVARAGVGRSNHDTGNVRFSTYVVPGLACARTVTDPPESPDEPNAVWGAGLEWTLATHMRLLAVLSRHDTDLLDRNVVSLSVAWVFGKPNR